MSSDSSHLFHKINSIIYPILPENGILMTHERSSVPYLDINKYIIHESSASDLRRPAISSRSWPIVRAAGILNKDSKTEVIDVHNLTEATTSLVQCVEVADANGILYCYNGHLSTSCWLKIVNIAKDCHSCNVLLVHTDAGVMLKTVKNITPGEPLLMWFAEHILGLLNMPFLTPANIQGQNCYTCHICNDIFENPNPLKIHLALDCDRLGSDHLWIILEKEFNKNIQMKACTNPYSHANFSFELSPSALPIRIPQVWVESNVSLRNNLMSTNNMPVQLPCTSSSCLQASPLTHISQLILPTKNRLQHSSAFMPYNHYKNIYKATQGSPKAYTPPNSQAAAKPHTPATSFAPSETSATPTLHSPSKPIVHPEQMERIVSNLGTSNDGHICVYCGKIYSRKYGLKIHIRTHTGYKPLKCKFCMRAFGDPSNLNKHIRLHADGDTPYRCNLCGKILVRRRDLERHIKSRHQTENAEGSVTESSSEGIEL